MLSRRLSVVMCMRRVTCEWVLPSTAVSSQMTAKLTTRAVATHGPQCNIIMLKYTFLLLLIYAGCSRSSESAIRGWKHAPHFGYTRLNNDMHTVSFCLMLELNMHFIKPCVPNDSVILPVRPYFVHSSTGLNHCAVASQAHLCKQQHAQL